MYWINHGEHGEHGGKKMDDYCPLLIPVSPVSPVVSQSLTYNNLKSVYAESGHATLGRRYSTARVSKRPIRQSAACLRARYCTNLTWFDLHRGRPLREGQWTVPLCLPRRQPDDRAAFFR